MYTPPQTCLPYMVQAGSRLWIGSAGTSQQLHFDWCQNIFVHLAGEKTVILLPPNATMEQSFMLPSAHFSKRQSQILWTNSSSNRRPRGFASGAQGLPSDLAAKNYPSQQEIHVALHPGSVLFIPMGWGHQTFTTSQGRSY